MEFDINRVYTAVNADELKPGSKVFVADNIAALKQKVGENALHNMYILDKVLPATYSYRFEVQDVDFILCYLVSEPEPEGLHWTKLKIGDVIQNVSKGMIRMVTGIDSFDPTNDHIFAGQWLSDSELKDWEKVDE